MREFLILIGELMFIAVIQIILEAILDEWAQKRAIIIINIACIIISYFLLFRYVYNHFIRDLLTVVNYYF